MDIERLTKAQIVLLTLLVSFVTSIATGIVTVTLLDQAPPAITQTINRIVERTVERVVPGETQNATVITKEKTVVVNEEDLVTQAIDKNTGRIAKIYRNGESGFVFVGVGVIVSKDGVVAVATDRSSIIDDVFYTAELFDGRQLQTEVLDIGADKPTILLEMIFTEEDGYIPAGIEYSDINSLRLGQTVLTISGDKRIRVATGIISGLDEEEIEVKVDSQDVDQNQDQIDSTTTVFVLKAVETNIAESDIEIGSPLLNIFGEVIGINTSQGWTDGSANFTPIQIVKTQIAAVAEQRTAELLE